MSAAERLAAALALASVGFTAGIGYAAASRPKPAAARVEAWQLVAQTRDGSAFVLERGASLPDCLRAADGLPGERWGVIFCEREI